VVVAVDFPVAVAAAVAVAREGAGNMQPRAFSKHLDHDGIVAAIRDAELKTTGQIRVRVSPKHIEDAVAAAQTEFLRLGLQKFPERNAILIFVAPRAHKFAVFGDEAVHAQCGAAFWRELAEAMEVYFRRSEFTPGIIHGVQKAGELLAQHFPRPKA
jgi:uncharacterized membrane protein